MAEANQDFAYWWDQKGDWVEEPNERREGSSGVQFLPATEGRPNLYSKRQINHCYRSLRHPLGRPTVFREEQAIRAFNALGVQTPKLVFCGAEQLTDHWRALLVTEELAGFVSLDDWYAADAGGPDVDRTPMLEQIARMLVSFHRAGWQHSCCYGKHIFVRPAEEGGLPEVAMLDLEKARRRWPATSAARHDLDQLSRHRGEMPTEDWQTLLQLYEQQWPAMSDKLASLK